MKFRQIFEKIKNLPILIWLMHPDIDLFFGKMCEIKAEKHGKMCFNRIVTSML